MTIQPPPPPPPPFPQQVISAGAGFWIRALARIIDMVCGQVFGLIGGFCGAIILAILQATGRLSPGWETRITGTSGAMFGLSFLGGFLYHWLCEGIHGATLGKLICGLRVMNQDGRASNMKGALIRGLGWFLDALFFGLIGYTSMQRSALNQRYGDVWGKTVVAKTRDISPGSRRSAGHFLLGLFLGGGCWTVLLTIGVILEAT